jgi:hypothetical protein
MNLAWLCTSMGGNRVDLAAEKPNKGERSQRLTPGPSSWTWWPSIS